MTKSVAKKYLKIVIILFLSLFVLSAGIVFGLHYSSVATVDFSIIQLLGLALCGAYIPSASFTGFVVCFLRVNELDKKQQVLLVLFFPIVLVLITLVGVVMLVPQIIKSIVIIKK